MNHYDTSSPLLQRAENNISVAIKAEKKKDFTTARMNYLAASKLLLEAARFSSGVTKDKRLEFGELLLKKGKSLPKENQKEFSKHKEDKESLDTHSLILSEKPDVTYQDVAGLEEAKEKVRDRAILARQDPEKAKKWQVNTGGGILLYGPPGTGKTFFAKATAGEIDATFYSVKGDDIMSKWVGESEKKIARLFAQVRSEENAVLFIDEIDAMIPKRAGQTSTIMQRVVPQFLAEIDGISSKNDNLLLIAATNVPWNIDDAALRPGRFDFKIYVPLPEFSARQQIFEMNLQVPRNEPFDTYHLAEMTEGYSGADIASICGEARLEMYKRDLQNQTAILTIDTVLQFIHITKPSVKREALKKFEKFRDV